MTSHEVSIFKGFDCKPPIKKMLCVLKKVKIFHILTFHILENPKEALKSQFLSVRW